MKNRNIYTLIYNSLRGVAVPLFNFLLIMVGIRFFGKASWGELIQVQLAVFLLVFISNWGNKEYLLRKYSREPASMNMNFAKNFFSRSPFLILSLVLFLVFEPGIAALSIAWLLAHFLYSSLNSLIVYHQKFRLQLIAEAVSFVALLAAFFMLDSFALSHVILLYVFAIVVKTIILVFFLDLKGVSSARFSSKELMLSLPFFLIAFAGWLHTRTDLYIVGIYLSEARLSEYQLLVASFAMIQAVSGFVLSPFTKHIYRIRKQSLKKIRVKMMVLGLLVIVLGTPLVWLVLEKWACLELPWDYYVISGMASLAPFLYLVDVYALYRSNKETKIILLSFASAFVNATLTLLLIDHMGMRGALLGMFASQYFVLLAYKWIRK